ncbi:caspase family protein [Streptomyces sp. NPDC058739]|uniref:caspase family protein n=1 Tax=Streptomyces sp. NPDC058739 TaxID=3346618 RepID=UPI0036BA9F31
MATVPRVDAGQALRSPGPAREEWDAPGPQRFLFAAAVARVAAAPDMDRPELREDVDRMVGLFTEELGYRRVPGLDLDPTRGQLLRELGRFARSPERTPDDYVVVYLAAHGAVMDATGDHFLVTADADPDDLTGTALRTEELARVLWEGTGLHRVLLLIDSCHAEAGANDALMQALRSRRFEKPDAGDTTGFGVIASAGRKEFGSPGVFSRSFERAVRHEATAGHAPRVLSVDSVLASMSTDPDFPDWQRPRWAFVDGTSAIPGFLPNPRYLPGAEGLHLDEIDRMVTLRTQEQRSRQQELISHFLPRARGTDVPTEEVWDFTGRHEALRELSGWLRAPDAASTFVVTGDPGSGKSSVLGMLAVLSDPERRRSVPTAAMPPEALPPPGAFAAAVHANHKTVRQVLDALCAAANVPAETVGGLIAGLQRRAEPMVVLVDAVDEALDPGLLVTELLQPLAELAATHPLRLLLGARRHIAERFDDRVRALDLDDERYADPEAVRAYIRRLLTAPGSMLSDDAPELLDAIGEAVAEAAGLSFLVARITARTLTRQEAPDPYDPTWRAELPRLPGEAMERDLRQQLGDEVERAHRLLVPLAFAQGAGLPWAGLWPQLASVIADVPFTDEDVVWLHRAAGSYVVESVEDSGSVYRIYHQALVEYLRQGLDSALVHGRVTRFLLDRVPSHLDQGGLPPYVRSYLGAHAAEAGLLEQVMADARFVTHADRDQLLAVLPRATRGEPRRAGRALADVHAQLRERAAGPPHAELAARLRLAALRQGNRALAGSVDRWVTGQPWRARWTLWEPRMADHALRDDAFLTATVGIVRAGPGRAQALTARDSAAATSWDLTTGVEQARFSGETVIDRIDVWVSGGARPVMLVRRDLALLGPPDSGGEEVARLDTERCLCALDRATGRIDRWLVPPWPEGPGFGLAPHARAVQAIAVEGAPGGDAEPVIAVRFSDGHAAVYRLPQALDTLSRRERRRRRTEQVRLPAPPPRTAVLVAVLGTAVTAIGHVVGGTGVVYEEDGGAGKHWLPGGGGASWHVDNRGAVALVALAGDTGNPTVVSSRRGGTLRVFEPGSADPPRVLDQASATVTALDAYQTGRRRLLAAATNEGLLLRYDLGTLRPLGEPTVAGMSGPSLLRILELGERLCVALNGTGDVLHIRELFSGERLIGAVRHAAITALRFLARDGSAGVAGDEEGGLRFWGPDGAPAEEVTGHQGGVLAVDALGDPAGDASAPKRLVSVGADDRVHCWDVDSLHTVWSHRLERDHVWSLPPTSAFVLPLPEGALVVTGHDGGTVRVHRATGRGLTETARFRLPEADVVAALAGHERDGRLVLAVAAFFGQVSLWDGAGTPLPGPTPPEELRIGYPASLSVVRDSTGELVVVGVDQGGAVQSWAVRERTADDGRMVQSIGGRTVTSFTENGRPSLVVAGHDGDLARWNRDNGAFRPDEARPWSGGQALDRITALAALTSAARPVRVLTGRESGRIDTVDTVPSHRSVPVSHDVHAVGAVACTELYGAHVVLSGTDDGRVMVNDLETGVRAAHLTSRHTAPVEAVCVAREGDLVRIFALHRDLFIQRWDILRWDFGGAGTRVLPVICDCPALYRTTDVDLMPRADIPWDESMAAMHGRENVAATDLVRPGGRLLYRITHPEGFTCPGVWRVTAGHRTLVLGQDGAGTLRVAVPAEPGGGGWVEGVRLDIPQPLGVCADPRGDRVGILSADPHGAGTVLSVYTLDSLLTPVRLSVRRYQRRPRDPAPLRPKRRITVASGAASGLRALPNGPAPAAWAVLDGPLIRVLDHDGTELRQIDLGALCHDLSTAPDGALLAATQRGLVVLDPLV